MTDHTPTPWRVFTNDDGTKLVGIGARDGQGILDSGFGVWAWNDPEGIANAEMVIKAVNNHDALEKVRVIAEDVVWFDWSGNDPDAVHAIEQLRLALQAVVSSPSNPGEAK